MTALTSDGARHAPRLYVSHHAIERYQRRVENVPPDQAKAALSSERILGAARAGASAVVLPSGHRVILVGFSVVTVAPRHKAKRRAHRNTRERK